VLVLYIYVLIFISCQIGNLVFVKKYHLENHKELVLTRI